MQILAKRAFYGDEKGVKAGQTLTVSDPRGRELVRRGLAVEVGGKADAALANKMAPDPGNKTDADSDTAKTASEVLALADGNFMAFKSEAKKLLGDKTPATKAEIIAALEEIATQP